MESASSAEYGHLPPSYPQGPSNSHCWKGTGATAAACPQRQSDQEEPGPASKGRRNQNQRPNL